MKNLGYLVLLLCCLGPHQVWAEPNGDENSDLNLIPKSIETAKAEPSYNDSPHPNGKAYLEDGLTGWVNRRLPVPVPSTSQPSSWQNRTSLDLDYSWQVGENVKFNLSNRLNAIEGDTITFPSGENVRNDFREAYVTWEIIPQTYLEVGRINLKNGGALGYNPTDFFKSRTTVDISSIDPSALKEDRLGSIMVKCQKIWDNGTVTLAFSPRVDAESPLLVNQHSSLAPLFGQTNSDNRFLASLSYNIAGFNPQTLVFLDKYGTHAGVNVSRVVSSNVVAYAEWSGVREATLTRRAVTFGQNTGSLPQVAPLLPQTDDGKIFQNDLALGASWTSSFNLTINLEYHYHQSGFRAADFNNWASLGSANPRLASEFWFIRQFASDQQEPLMQHEIFLRFDWKDIIPSKLNVAGVTFVSPYDASVLSQVSAQYFISRNWTLGLYIGGTVGSAGSVNGSLPWSASGVFQIVRYL